MPLDNSFAAKDAQSLIIIARRAPLQHMDEAEAVANLLARFAAWANAQLHAGDVGLPTDPETPTAAALRAAGIPVPEGHPEDPLP